MKLSKYGYQNIFCSPTFIPAGVKDISFYEKASGAVELQRWTNDDGTIHVAELSIEGCLFHLHEEKTSAGEFCPQRVKGITTLIGLFVPDVDSIMEKAVKAEGVVLSQAQTYEYGYRQGEIKDPFGHVWLIEMKTEGIRQ